MRVLPLEVRLLPFTESEREQLRSVFMFGDAEEILSYAVHCLGSVRVATLIVEAKNIDMATLALADVDGFSDDDRKRLENIPV